MYASSQSLYVVLFGRFVFGLGGETLTVAQSTYTAQWFKGAELSPSPPSPPLSLSSPSPPCSPLARLLSPLFLLSLLSRRSLTSLAPRLSRRCTAHRPLAPRQLSVSALSCTRARIRMHRMHLSARTRPRAVLHATRRVHPIFSCPTRRPSRKSVPATLLQPTHHACLL